MATKIKTFAPGTKVRFTARFLRSTGQIKGGEGRKVWTVLRQDGEIVMTDEEHGADYMALMWTPEEIAKEPDLKYRRINAGNLIEVGRLDATCGE